ncbi:MAG: 50S ribosomal protein L4 [Pseudomonadales bacterium]|nr:50S ribosomal protein L4 [Candidatus Woesebacteria bacterium]MCB9801706.1 50S ribosomal protein L4 [Pseudomonadales bacterium]
MKLTKYSSTGSKTSITVPDLLFAKPNAPLVAQAVRVYLSNQRQGTSSTQTRSDVTTSHRKIYKQKGTGGARHGSRNAPIFVGGGVAHGPTGTQNWSRSLSKQMKRGALIASLSAQVDRCIVHEGLDALSGKTKEAAQLLSSVSDTTSLVVLAERSEVIERSLRNIPAVSYTTASLLTAFDVARAHTIIFAGGALDALQQRLAKQPTKAAPTKKSSSTAKKTVSKQEVTVEKKSSKKSKK